MGQDEIFDRLADVLFKTNQANPAHVEDLPTLRLCYMVDGYQELIAQKEP